jgi:hypothetical protein
MAIGDPITMELRLAKIATGAKVNKGEVVGVTTRLTFEADDVGEEQVEQLARLQHHQAVTVIVQAAQLELALPGPKGRRRRAS